MKNLITELVSKRTTESIIEQYEKNQKEVAGELNAPVAIKILGLISMLIWAVAIVLVLVFSDDITAKIMCGVVFGILFLLGLYLFLYGKNHRVIYVNRRIIRRNIFGTVREYDCQNIDHAVYTDGGGVRFIFDGGKKLCFDSMESYFYKYIIGQEKIKCYYEGKDSTIVKVSIHPVFKLFWLLIIITGFVFVVRGQESLLISLVLIIGGVGGLLSYTTYNKDTKICVRRVFGVPKKYDMNIYKAKPYYEGGFLMAIEIYDKDKVIGKIPVSREYKNRRILIKLLCGIDG